MPQVNVAQLWKTVVYVNFKNTGWSETYYLPEQSYEAALPKAQQLVYGRSSLFATECEVKYARVSKVGNPRDAKIVDIPYPLQFNPFKEAVPGTIGGVDSPFTALHYRFETDTGRVLHRLFRGVPDADVYKFVNLNPIVPTPVGAAIPDLVLQRANRQNLQAGFLRWLMSNTLHVRKNGATWDVNSFDRCVAVKVSNRKTGRPFGMFRGRGVAAVAVG